VPVARDVELAVRRWPGADVTFLLVHGLASNARMWDGVAGRLVAAGHGVVAVDLRGHGRSDRPATGYDFATVTDDLHELVERLELDRPVAVGQSWGGNLVVELAARFPDLVRGIACVDGGTIDLQDRFPDWEACRIALAPPELAGIPATAMEARVRAMHPDWPETGIAGVMANFEVRVDGTVAPRLTLDRHLAILRGLWEHRPLARLAQVRVPVLLLPADSGEGPSAADKRASIERARAAGPGIRVRWFTPADHDVHAQRPAEVAAALLEEVEDRG
jgi:pimeloyl-ACP methyl ester carboxylesterase